MIKAIHLDDRLIHGQVAISWTRFLDANVLLVVNDEIVNDSTRRNALKLGVPAGVKFGFRSVEDGIAFLNSNDSASYKIMVLINNPIDACKVALGVNQKVDRLTIGGVRKNAPYVMDNLNLTDEDVEALKKVMSNGISVGVLPTPTDKFRDLEQVFNNLKGD